MPRTSRVPKGRLKTLSASGCWTAPQPSLRDGSPWVVEPSVETLGYSHRSLRDKERSELGNAFGFERVNKVPAYQISKLSVKLRPRRIPSYAPHIAVHPAAFFQIGTVRFISSMRSWHAAKASPRWGAITSTHRDGSPTFTAPRRWTSRTDSIGQRLSIS